MVSYILAGKNVFISLSLPGKILPVFESLPPSFWVQIRQRDKHGTRTPLSKDPAGAIAVGAFQTLCANNNF